VLNCCLFQDASHPNRSSSRASRDDVRTTINKAVGLALQAHIGALSPRLAEGDGSAASRRRWVLVNGGGDH
jgi:hypothetical protein